MSDVHPDEIKDNRYRMLTDRTMRSVIDRTCYMCGGVIERSTIHRYMSYVAEDGFHVMRGHLENMCPVAIELSDQSTTTRAAAPDQTIGQGAAEGGEG